MKMEKRKLPDHEVNSSSYIHTLSPNTKKEKLFQTCLCLSMCHFQENECPERDQSCEYCELTLPLSSLKEHIVACGSRTERCEDCNQYVILKDKLQHAQICTSEDFSFKSKSV